MRRSRNSQWFARQSGCAWVVHGLKGSPLWNRDLADVPRRTLRSKKEVYEVEAPRAKAGGNLVSLRQMPGHRARAAMDADHLNVSLKL